ncbi:MAG: bifunctional phosphoribosylaminoimidazolecarboxamide formyltransferase/IMP cyclohydrolase [Candidatus Aminicenantia bacterium]
MKRVLISVYDKRNLKNFAEGLINLNWEIIATGGTARFLKENNIDYLPLSKITGFPEILDGRVKTLHPHILGGILAIRAKKEHLKELDGVNIKPIDMVVVNLYPFQEVTAKKEVDLEEALENIDIGGVSLIRAAAKNFRDVIVIVDLDDYSEILRILAEEKEINQEKRVSLAIKAFKHTSIYDYYIFNYLNSFSQKKELLPSLINLNLSKFQELRYGENPHQKGALYIDQNSSHFEKMIQHQGKDLSFNNLLDINSAYELCLEFKETFCCILKHNNPCGAAIGKNTLGTFQRALATDPMSAFGGIIGFNCSVNEQTAAEIIKSFFEVVVAPSYSKKALEIFQSKKNLRIVELPYGFKDRLDFRKINGGWLIQEKNNLTYIEENLKIVTRRKPSNQELNDLLFAWKIVKHIKSNAIVFVKNQQTLGIGAGQMSRVDAAKLAIMKAQLSLKGSAIASDAFFPFPDALEECIKAGAAAAIQPGGSIRDNQVIETADRYNISMIFTGIRHFRH